MFAADEAAATTPKPITPAIAIKSIVLLILRGAIRSLFALGRLLSEAAEARGSAIATTYLTAMGIGDSALPLDRRQRQQSKDR